MYWYGHSQNSTAVNDIMGRTPCVHSHQVFLWSRLWVLFWNGRKHGGSWFCWILPCKWPALAVSRTLRRESKSTSSEDGVSSKFDSLWCHSSQKSIGPWSSISSNRIHGKLQTEPTIFQQEIHQQNRSFRRIGIPPAGGKVVPCCSLKRLASKKTWRKNRTTLRCVTPRDLTDPMWWM